MENTQEPSIGMVTVDEVMKLVSRYNDERLKSDSMRAELKAQDAVVDEIEGRLIATLEALNLKSFKSDVATVDVAYRTSVKTPQGEAREAFFNYLKEIGAFDSLITVNSQTLNGWYRLEEERAAKEKRLLRIPGLDMPTKTPMLKLRRN